jgi:putative tricarboxylic transport membrane protein
MIDNLVNAFALILSVKYFLIILAGVCTGIVVGALPGLSPSIGVALLVPFTYGMEPLTALILLTTVYLASNYGGSITAIAINTPGTAGAVATTFDGYELTKQGKPGLALGVSIVASTYGGLLGTVILIIFSVPLARMALTFGPAEYFSLALFGLTIVSSLSAENWLKGFLATLAGLLLTTIGMDPFTGYLRFTFGVPNLADGFAFIPSLIGIFALGEVFMNLEQINKEAARKITTFSSALPSFKQLLGLNRVMFKSGLIGTLVGVIPGAGATIATFIAYNEAKRTSREPEKFGKGSLEGVALWAELLCPCSHWAFRAVPQLLCS